MKIVLEKKATVTEEVEVDFPLYRDTSDSLDSGGWDTLYRIEGDGTYFQLTKRYSFSASEPAEYKFEQGKMDLKRDLSGYLSNGVSATEREFNALLSEMRQQLSKFPAL